MLHNIEETGAGIPILALQMTNFIILAYVFETSFSFLLTPVFSALRHIPILCTSAVHLSTSTFARRRTSWPHLAPPTHPAQCRQHANQTTYSGVGPTPFVSHAQWTT